MPCRRKNLPNSRASSRVLKTNSCVMLLLLDDVSPDTRRVQITNGKRPVTTLPSKTGRCRSLGPDPYGRTPLHLRNHVPDRIRSTNRRSYGHIWPKQTLARFLPPFCVAQGLTMAGASKKDPSVEADESLTTSHCLLRTVNFEPRTLFPKTLNFEPNERFPRQCSAHLRMGVSLSSTASAVLGLSYPSVPIRLISNFERFFVSRSPRRRKDSLATKTTHRALGRSSLKRGDAEVAYSRTQRCAEKNKT